MKAIRAQVVAEIVGAFGLVFIGAGSVAVASVGSGNLLTVAVAHGLVLALMVTAFGHISGAHFNPAVTIGVWVVGKIETARAAVYVVAQLVGAALAALLLRVILPGAVWGPTHIGLPTVNHTGGFTNGQAVLLEAVLTFFLVTMVFATAIDERGAFKAIAGFGIGLVLTMDVLVGGPFTGASMNPARTFGPALVAGRWSDFWVYIAGPVLGGIVAASLYWYMFLREGEPPAPPAPEETRS